MIQVKKSEYKNKQTISQAGNVTVHCLRVSLNTWDICFSMSHFV